MSILKRSNHLIRIFSFPIDSQRVYGLDILRAAAICFVLFLHGLNLLSQHLVTLIYPYILDGVTIFFVLSGFLIGTILIRTLDQKEANWQTLRDFWFKRWLRTLPNYWMVLTLLCILSWLWTPDFHLTGKWKYFLFLQNFNTAQPPFFGESWSLSVEEWFYLIVPVLLISMKSLIHLPANKIVLITIILIIAIITGLRIFRWQYGGINSLEDWDGQINKQVITRLDGIMYGVLGAYVAWYHPARWKQWRWFCFALALGLLAVRLSDRGIPVNVLKLYMCVFYFPVYQLAVLLMLPLLTQIKTGRGLIFRLITTISIISYSMYLLHFSLVKGWIIGRFPGWGLKGIPLMLTRYFLYWGITVLLSILNYKYFERPVMDLRKKWL